MDRKKYKIIFFCVIAVLFLLYVFSNVKKYLYIELDPVQIPKAYPTINQYLEDQKGIFKAIWLTPQFGARRMKWITKYEKRAIGDFVLRSSAKPTISQNTPYTKLYYLFTDNLLGKVPYFDRFFDFLNTRFIIWRSDRQDLHPEDNDRIIEYLRDQPGLEFITEDSYLNLFENKKYANLFFVPAKNFLVVGGLETLEFLYSLENFDATNANFVFLDQGVNPGLTEKLLDKSFLIFQDTKPQDLIFHLLPPQNFVSFAPYTHSDLTKKEWIQASSYEPLHGEWHRVIEQDHNITNWDFDYGQGLIYSDSDSIINLPLEISEEDDYIIYLRYFQNKDGGEILFSLDQNQKSIISTQGFENKFVWKEVPGMHLTPGKHNITIKNIYGFNALNILSVVPQKDFQKYSAKTELILNKHAPIYLKKINPQLSIHPINLDLPASQEYNLSLLAEPAPAAEEAEINLDNEKSYKISFDQTINENHWYPLGPIRLGQGAHSLFLSSPKSKNEIQPENFKTLDYPAAQFKIDSQGISIVGAESETLLPSYISKKERRVITDLIPVEAEINYYLEFQLATQKIKGVYARVLFYGNDYNEKTNRRAFMVKKIMEPQEGSFNFRNFNKSFETPNGAAYLKVEFKSQENPDETSYWWLKDLQLYNISQISYADGILLHAQEFSFDQNNLNNPPQVNFSEISATKYKVEIKNATEPFILAFAETFDPLWQAKINGEKINSFPLYSLINGFYVEKTGDFDLIIEYLPQKWLKRGLLATAASLSICLLAIIITRWRKNKSK